MTEGSIPMTAEGRPARAGWAVAGRWWRVAQYPLSLLLAGVALYVVFGKRDEIAGASAYLDHLHLQWISLAVAAELLAIFAFAALQRRLLASGRLTVGYGSLTALTYAGNAIANSLPGGPAWGSVYAYRQFRRLGADEALAAWTLIAVSVCSAVGLAVVAAAGLAIAGVDQGSDLNLVLVIVGTVVAVAAAAAIARQRAFLERVAVRILTAIQRVVHRPAGRPEALVAEASSRLTAITPSAGQWTQALGWATANWLWDCGCLALCFAAVGAEVPWRGLLLAYGAAQLAANLPVTPGGLGVVEGSLTIALVAYGGAEASTVAAVLLYRIISFWALLPIGYCAWGGLALRFRMRGSPMEAT